MLFTNLPQKINESNERQNFDFSIILMNVSVSKTSKYYCQSLTIFNLQVIYDNFDKTIETIILSINVYFSSSEFCETPTA